MKNSSFEMVRYRNLENVDLSKEYKSISEFIGVLGEVEAVVGYEVKTISEFSDNISNYLSRNGTLALLDIPVEPLTKLNLELLIIDGPKVAKQKLKEKQMKGLSGLLKAVDEIKKR